MSEEQLEILWYFAPAKTKMELAINLVVEVLKAAEDQRAWVSLDDGKYEITMKKLEATTDQK